ncbi:hypothetical protein AG1IA_01760 [Rhizoctonia solani AG-1 IA]|uniref:Uncharacterized protein n=1 Tax=Thanatephorus cucumeris (strain AG1-IA) TaxID=983506 RepID=L8X592_THACA|nr:hypothetical protein AG1IA_01760 [Rhizoctonia solani AG-1 IA]
MSTCFKQATRILQSAYAYKDIDSLGRHPFGLCSHIATTAWDSIRIALWGRLKSLNNSFAC